MSYPSSVVQVYSEVALHQKKDMRELFPNSSVPYKECVDTDGKLLFLPLEEDRGRSPHVDIKVTTLFDTRIKKQASGYETHTAQHVRVVSI